MQSAQHENSMFDWWKLVTLKNYANFKGRARRAEFWSFLLMSFMMLMPVVYLQFIAAYNRMYIFNTIVQITIWVLILVLLSPLAAVATRRLHDVNKSGFFFMLAIVPIVTPIVILFTFLNGNKITNKYGLDPKNPNSDEHLYQSLA
jgi:uncharacterized membrane protein YhaH (DUF805 family)